MYMIEKWFEPKKPHTQELDFLKNANLLFQSLVGLVELILISFLCLSIWALIIYLYLSKASYMSLSANSLF